MHIWEVTGEGTNASRPASPKRTTGAAKKKRVIGKTAWEKNYSALKRKKRDLKPRSPVKPVRMIG